MYDHEALLPTGTTINPSSAVSLADHDYFLGHGDMLIMQDVINPKRYRAWAGANMAGAYAEGTVHSAHHDQAGYYMGTYKVVGYVHANGTVKGELPNRKIPYWVFK